MPPLGSTAQVNSCPSTHTNTFIDTMSTAMRACDQMDGMFPEQSISPSRPCERRRSASCESYRAAVRRPSTWLIGSSALGPTWPALQAGHVVLDAVRNELVRAHPLPFADIEGDALSHAKLLRSVTAKGLEPPGISSQIQLFIHRHLQAAASVHCHGHVRLGADRTTVGGENGRPVLRQPNSRGDIRCRLADARKEHKRLALELSAWMRPSPRRYATSVSTLSVDVTGNVTVAPTGDAPAEPSATYGVTSTAFASCAAAGNAPRVNATSAKTADL